MSSACAAVLCAAACLIVCCSPRHDDPGQFIDIDPQGWLYGQKLTFEPGADSVFIRPARHIPVSNEHSHIELTVRHSDAYPYSNLWVELAYPTGDTVVCDTFNLVIADRYGKWLGNGTGPSYQKRDTLVTRLRVNDNPHLTLRHIMRVDTLREIEQVGMRMLKR